MHKIVCIGPESTGKTTLASQLAEALQCDWIPEYARSYIDDLGRPYNEADLETIARGQIALEDDYAKQHPNAKMLVCDTNVNTVYIWAQQKYDRSDPYILDTVTTRPYAAYLLCGVDVPWEEDPQRENPHDREELYSFHKFLLQLKTVPHVELKGDPATRLAKAIKFLRMLEIIPRPS